MKDVIIYTVKNTERVQYTCKVFFEILLGLNVILTEDKEYFINSSFSKINYSNAKLTSNEIRIPTHSLLFEKNIILQETIIFHHKTLPAFFETPDSTADFSFDILAMTFYLISRYEEYLPFEKDKFERYSAQKSLAQKEDFLLQPLVDQWSIEVGKLLKEKFPIIEIKKKQYQFRSTFDIDCAWAFRYRGIKRTFNGYVGDLLRGRGKTLKKRIGTHFFGKKDPYQVFEYLEKIHQNYQVKPTWFFLLGDDAPFDFNISHQVIPFQKLIQNIDTKYEVGIHPSMRSNKSFTFLQQEKKRLENIIGKEVTKSRQHFLMLKFPETYRNLLKTGIREDHTMGYADDIGFRASIATSYPWFDLLENKATQLMIHPFQVMDGTLNANYLDLSQEEALERVKELIKTTQAVGGTFCLLWHNSTLSEMDEWDNGWFDLYEKILQSNSEVLV